MTLIRTPIVAALTVAAALAVGAPAAGASTAGTTPFSFPIPSAGSNAMPLGALPIPADLPVGACSSNTAGQGRTGGTAGQACVGAGLVFIGPSSSVSTVMGPTIIGPFVGSSIVSGGDVSIGP
jgi:hypothetical protein